MIMLILIFCATSVDPSPAPPMINTWWAYHPLVGSLCDLPRRLICVTRSLTHSLDLALDFIRRRSWGGVGCDGGRRGWMVDDRLSVRTVFLEPLSRISNIVFGVRLWLDSTGMGLGFVRASLRLLMDSNWGMIGMNRHCYWDSMIPAIESARCCGSSTPSAGRCITSRWMTRRRWLPH